MDILKKLEQHRDMEQRLKWEGTFAEYLEMLKEEPWVAQTAHSRIYNMIKDAGIEEVNGKKTYSFFNNNLYGLEEALERLVEEYFHPAAKRLDVKKRILLLMGPVSGGKSTLVTMLKRGLEAYSRTEQGSIFAIKGCPMHEDACIVISNHKKKTSERGFLSFNRFNFYFMHFSVFIGKYINYHL